jgi:triosephosphate isomerase
MPTSSLIVFFTLKFPLRKHRANDMLKAPLLIANWKMYYGVAETRDVLRQLVQKWPKRPRLELTICPSFPTLESVARTLKGSGIAFGAQDMFWESEGAYTGEVSAGMLRELGCRSVILGHSERRQHLGETDAMVRRKLLAAFAARLNPIVCVGETREERSAGKTSQVLERQLRTVFTNLPPTVADHHLTVAYEPLWAISSARDAVAADQATMDDARETIWTILNDVLGHSAMKHSLRLLYGGSVTPDNITDYVHAKAFDGVLVGHASLTVKTLLDFHRQFSSANAHERR